MPKSVVQFKAEIAAADALLLVTLEHNRPIPALLKNAIDWGARPYCQNSAAAITGASLGDDYSGNALRDASALGIGGWLYL
jgi:chromate reductase